MNKNLVLVLLTIAGAIIGYGVGKMENVSNFLVIVNINMGAFLFWNLGRAFYAEYYLVLVGPISGLVVCIGLEILAGSEIVARAKLLYMVMGLFIGWIFGKFWKPLFVSSIIGGIIGFVWGLNDIWRFGNVALQPGVLNASLMAIEYAFVGMSLAGVIAHLFAQKSMVRLAPSSRQNRHAHPKRLKK